jgi:hypothetical protein
MYIGKKLKGAYKTPYQQIAEKYGTTAGYVSDIANGWREGKRGRGALIKAELDKLQRESS